MQNKLFLKAADICELLEVKQTSAHQMIGSTKNQELKSGILTLIAVVSSLELIYKLYLNDGGVALKQKR